MAAAFPYGARRGQGKAPARKEDRAGARKG